MVRSSISPQLETELAAIAAQAGCELVRLEFKGSLLRLFIDRPEGVSLEDCAAVSRAASAVLDLVDFGPAQYTLEVSSPGLDRELLRAEDYRRFAGRRVRVTFREEDGRKRTVVAQLQQLTGTRPDDGVVTLTTEEEGTPLALPLASIQSARLVPEL